MDSVTNIILHLLIKVVTFLSLDQSSPKTENVYYWPLINVDLVNNGLCKNKEVKMSWLYLGHKHIIRYTKQP